MFHFERLAMLGGRLPDEKIDPEAYRQMIAFLASPDKEDLEDAADSGIDNPTWRPHCMNCPTFRRMKVVPTGFHCNNCGRDIGHKIPGTGQCWTEPGKLGPLPESTPEKAT